MFLANLPKSPNVYIQQCGFVVINNEVTSSKACIIRKLDEPEFTNSLEKPMNGYAATGIVVMIVIAAVFIHLYQPKRDQ